MSNNSLWRLMGAWAAEKKTPEFYVAQVRQLCEFLQAQIGTAEAEERIVALDYMQALEFKNWLYRRPGLRPQWGGGGQGSPPALCIP